MWALGFKGIGFVFSKVFAASGCIRAAGVVRFGMVVHAVREWATQALEHLGIEGIHDCL